MQESTVETINHLPQCSRLIKKLIGGALAAQLALVPVLSINAFAQSNDQSVTQDSPTAIIYDNGPFQTGPTTKSGVAAPAGAQWSEAQNNFGDTTGSNTNAGYSVNQSGFRLADNFVVPVGETWTLNSVVTFAYLTGFTGTTSPFTAGTLRIWNGRPGDAGSTIVFGDTTTNRLATSTDTNTFRIFNTVAPPPGSAPGTTRRIWQNTLSVSPALVLTTGNYWIDWATTVNNNPATTHFAPSTTVVNARTLPLANARQQTVTTGAWVDTVDAGNPAATPDVLQDFPFKLDGTRTGARTVPTSRTIDFNGDNRTDFAVARAANATAQTQWLILDSTNTPSGFEFGTGVGFTGGDIAVPADYDGDGRTDAAVWRATGFGDPQRSYFFILQSSTNTVRSEQFGAQGDDPTVVGDYDGDGKADLSVYRNGSAAGAQSVFYYRPSATAGADFTAVNWGVQGDRPYPGDFDGDGRYDFAIYRDSGGNAVHYQLRSTQGFVAAFYGLITDRFVTADFDGDYKTDLVAVRAAGSNYTWFVTTSTSNQFLTPNFGNPTTDFITPGDYDGDSRTDFAVWRGGQPASFIVVNTATAPLTVLWGQSAGALTAPDVPISTVVNVHPNTP